jgi:hypothetical protein
MVEAAYRAAVSFRAVSGGLLATAVTYLERARGRINLASV